VWGWTFVVVKDAVAAFPVAAFLAYRFALAAVALVPLVTRARPRSVALGAIIGLTLAAGYLLQTLGLTLTRASDAGIITGLFVVFTPIVDRLAFGVRARPVALAGVALTIPGFALLLGGVPEDMAVGDLLVAGAALSFAVHIVLLSRFSLRHDPRALTFGQIACAAIIFIGLAATPAGGGLAPPATVELIAAVVITGLVATTLAFFVQTWAQRQLAATPTAVILATEPAWATFFGILLAGDSFPPVRAAGALLLLAAPLVAVLLTPAARASPDPAS
jgi:drug/metabolite transporter (DMT)-like permease